MPQPQTIWRSIGLNFISVLSSEGGIYRGYTRRYGYFIISNPEPQQFNYTQQHLRKFSGKGSIMAQVLPSGCKKVTHCIFDMDGLLIDTETIYEEVVRQIAASFNKPYPLEVRFRLLGTTERKSAEIAITELGLPLTIDEYIKRYNELCLEKLALAPLMRGAERLLRHLHAHKIPIAMATSSSESMVQIKISKHHDVFDMLHHRVCGSSDKEVKNGKPAPDIFLIAAKRFDEKPHPSQCLVFEDAPNGVCAAVCAGMQVIMVPDDRVPTELRANATQVLKSLEDFKPEHFGLPMFPSNVNC